jgi:alpha-galactosidase
MSKPVRLTVIGAGSATFSLGLVKDICLTESLNGSHIVFEDIDAARLDVVVKLARRYAAELGANLTFETTTDLHQSLQGAEFVINTASVVSHDAAVERKKLAEKYGFYYGKADPGTYGWYNMRFMMLVAREMERTCPDAWLIQSGNPVFEGCTLMTRETGLKIIGLCHGHYGYRDICSIIGIDWRDVTYQAPGLNHNIWMTHFYYKGQDAYPLVDQWIDEMGPAYWADTSPSLPLPPERQKSWTPELQRAWEIDLAKGSAHMYRMFGLLPIGDTPRRVGWWYHDTFEAKARWFGLPYGGQDSHVSWPLYVANLEHRLRSMYDVANDPKAKLVDALGTTKTHEQQVPIIDALVNDNEGTFQINVPNQGALQGLPDDVVVEIPAVINKQGVLRLHVGALPPKIHLEQIVPDWWQMERQLLAFKTGDRSILLYNQLQNHGFKTYDDALSFLEESLASPLNREMGEAFTWPKGLDKVLR